ncbi:ATP-binding response regulator [Roseiconus nitratireducens]|nr:ATP-binding protein [Roseiconus nitratireducens]
MKPVVLVAGRASNIQQQAGLLLGDCSKLRVEHVWDADQAIERLAQSRVDVIVAAFDSASGIPTEFVDHVRRTHPQVTMLALTAQGSESEAEEALSLGVATYVPAAHLTQRLQLAVSRLITRGMVDRCRNFAGRRLAEERCRYELDNDLFMIEPVVSSLHRTMASMEVGDPWDRIRACTALEEAITNAILHGNLEIRRELLARLRSDTSGRELKHVIHGRNSHPEYRQRKVIIDSEITRDRAKFVIRDAGNGFDVREYSRNDLRDLFAIGHDRGLNLMHRLSSEIRFNDAANEVMLATVRPL